MDSFLLLQWFSPFLVVLVFLYKKWSTPKNGETGTKTQAPLVSGAWPIVGHLHLFSGRGGPHKVLASLAEKYGPVFRTMFGKYPTLVVSDAKILKECFTTNDIRLSHRPSNTAFHIMGYDQESVVFAPYGPFWRELRRICTLKLLSNHRLRAMKEVRNSEIDACFRDLYNKWQTNKIQEQGADHPRPVLVDMKLWFVEVSYNVAIRVIAGKVNFGSKIERGDKEAVRYKKIMDEILRLLAVPMFSDVSPLLGWIDIFKGHVGAMKKVAKEVDCFLEDWLEEHRTARSKRLAVASKTNKVEDSTDEEQDFVDILLSIMDENIISSAHDNYTTIKATLLAMILGGNDASALSLIWTVSLLMNNRHILKKAQEEIDQHVGKERQVEDSDIKNLVYLDAIIKETMRLYPLDTVLLRETNEDCEVGGFHVKGGTRLMVNVWKIQRDPNVWINPDEFKPERFLGENGNIDVGGQHYELIPFGTGRRVCPGMSFALQFMHLVLARLIHEFELETPNNADVDLSESTEAHVNLKSSPLDLLITPRLSSKPLAL